MVEREQETPCKRIEKGGLVSHRRGRAPEKKAKTLGEENSEKIQSGSSLQRGEVGERETVPDPRRKRR